MSFEDLERGRSSYPPRQSNPFSGAPSAQYGGGGFGGEDYGGGFDQGKSQWEEAHRIVYDAVSTLSSNLPKIQRMLGKIGTVDDSVELRMRIKTDLEACQNCVRHCTKPMTDMKQLQEASTDPAENARRRKVLAKLGEEFARYFELWKKISKEWTSKERNPLPAGASNRASQRGGWGGGINESLYSQDPSSIEGQENAPLLGFNRDQLQQIDSEVEYNSFIIKEREKEIKDIESTVLEVNEMWRDLGTLVHEQGDMIDSIENHIETAAIETTKGVDELVKASEHQKGANKKTCLIGMIIVCCLIVVLVLAALGISLSFGF